ncbi:hypothetical protein BX661DRAFT_187207 [Kickxella alabastrina]|uniref:uncharacterized protein n=1 Tax=Kickxella alabastrina TaxID=61397 RepID=UPI002220267F|nr:uncharacterized protein BX661DRAFT_187207 [Kickxella alabastrina]KAI7822809.1 hypothetical protein BX661DRAFT_187207 [Kickxella alabastrina]
MRFFTSCFGDNDAYNSRHGGRRVVTKAMIGLPSNFVHTGHLGIGAVRNDGYEMVQDVSAYTKKWKNKYCGPIWGCFFCC